MGTLSNSDFLLKFASELKARHALPKNIELAQVGPVFMASIFNELRSEIITESIFTGMDVDPDIAVLKGLVEMTERGAFVSGKKNGLPSCNTNRSDGFAAFPCGVLGDSALAARSNAYFEAIERFAWATWWDNKSIRHKREEILINSVESAAGILLKELSSFLEVESIQKIEPEITNAGNTHVAIYFIFLKPYGVISGGAAGSVHDIESVNFRAVCELFRHALAIRKIKTSSSVPSTFYERRLAHFGMTQPGTAAAKARVFHEGWERITLPKLSIDEIVPHSLSEIVSVHRCYFENQPPFVGGDLERLCL